MKLYHGDCIELMKNIKDNSIDLIATDLPFGVVMCDWDIVIPFDKLWKEYKRIIKPNGAIVLNSQQPFTSQLIISNLDWFKYSLIWDKSLVTGFLDANRKPLKRHEDICVFYNKQPTYNPQFTQGKAYKIVRNAKTSIYGEHDEKTSTENSGRRYPTSIISIPQKREQGGHPTQKPVELLEYLIKTYSNEGDTVLDSTMGSGTTGIACLNLKREFVGIEEDGKFFEMAKQRLESHEQRNSSSNSLKRFIK